MSATTIHKIKKSANFTIISNDYLNDERLSLKDVGLLTYLLSKPKDWKIYVSQLADALKDGKDSIRSSINNLIKCGYIKRTALRIKGKFKRWLYEVFEEPGTRVDRDSAPDVDTSDVVNPPLQRTEIKKNKKQTTIADDVPKVKEKPKKEQSEVVVCSSFDNEVMNQIPENQRSSCAIVCKRIFNRYGADGLKWHVRYAIDHKARSYGAYIQSLLKSTAYENHLNNVENIEKEKKVNSERKLDAMRKKSNRDLELLSMAGNRLASQILDERK